MSQLGHQGAWIFVSHSNNDLDQVKRVRNELEDRGHNPLLFFLKCLGDHEEIDDLIRREIEARTWFVLCDSPNARASRWVQTELEVIKSLEGKVFVTIDLDKDFDEQLQEIDRISERATVFISFAPEDRKSAHTFASSLRQQDYAVVTGELPIGTEEEAADLISDPARRALASGSFFLLLSPQAVQSSRIRHELEVALREADSIGRRSSVVPVVIGDREATLRQLSDSPINELVTGLHILSEFGRHRGVVGACAASPDGTFVVSGGDDAVMRIWDFGTGEERHTLEGHGDAVNACVVAPDRSFIVSGSGDRTVRTWDPGTGHELMTFEGHRGGVNACAVAPDGSFVVSGSDDRTLRMWDARTGGELRTLELHSAVVSACATSPDGSFIASTSADGTVAIWDPRDGAVMVVLRDDGRSLTTCAVSPDGSFFVTGNSDGIVVVWESATGRPLARIAAVDGAVTTCAVSPDGGFIVAGGADRTVKVWDAATGWLGEPATVPLFGWVGSAALHPWRPLVAVGDARGSVNLIRLGGIEYGPVVVTADDTGEAIRVRCPVCGVASPLDHSWLGNEVRCAQPECAARMRVNPFVARSPRSI